MAMKYTRRSSKTDASRKRIMSRRSPTCEPAGNKICLYRVILFDYFIFFYYVYIMYIRNIDPSLNGGGISKTSKIFSQRKPSFAFKSFVYNPHNIFSLSKLNPVNKYAHGVVSTFIKMARHRYYELSDNLKPITKKVKLKSTRKTPTFALDINPDGRKKYVLFMHGLTQNVTNLQNVYENIVNRTGYAVLAPEYRGFGKIAEKISSKTLRADAVAGLRYLVKEKKIHKKDIYIVGHSMGGSVATRLAADYPRTKGLVLVSAVDTLGSVINQSRVKGISKFAWYLLEKVKLFNASLNRFLAASEFIPKVKTPVSIIHSLDDNFVKPNSATSIAKRCKTLRYIDLVPNGGHRMEEKKINSLISVLNS